MTNKPNNTNLSSERNGGILGHLTELRSRLFKVILSIALVFLALFPFASKLYEFMAAPLLRYLPEGTSMIAVEVASPFLVPLKLSLLCAFLVALPYVLYQVWGFIAPGLYKNEKSLTVPLMISSTLLFYLGMAFAYFAVFPLIFSFFTGAAPSGVTVMTDIGHYLSFVFKIFIAFGIAFEMPVLTVLVVKSGFITAQGLSEKRPYIIVGAFVVGMVLTPPDVLSQFLLALPVWLLFELGLLFARLLEKRAATQEQEEPL